MNEELKRNVDAELEMLREISSYSKKLDISTEEEKRVLAGAIKSLRRGIKIVNASLPEILREIKLTPQLPKIPEKQELSKKFHKVFMSRDGGEIEVTLGSGQKSDFLRELSISEKYIRRIKKGKKVDKLDELREFKSSRGYLKLSNKFFLRAASESVKKGNFKSLSVALKKSNIDILFESYVAMIFFTTFIAFIIGIISTVFIFIFDVSTTLPFITLYNGSYLSRLARIFWIPFAMPILAFGATYYYPITEKDSLATRINQELPFAVIHMSAISGSGIAPTEIFKIIGMSRDYPYLRKELRKILNQINLYGYDLVTSLNNAAKSAPSEKLAELLSGFSTTITSGADMQKFLEKRAETLLLDYRLEREGYTKLIETFLDIYISIVIAAPMVFLLLIILMTISGVGVSFTTFQLSLVSVLGVAILNAVLSNNFTNKTTTILNEIKKKMHWIGIIASILIVIGDLIFFIDNSRMMFFFLGIALGVGALPFIINSTLENNREQKVNEMFLEFTRNLAEGVSTGTPVSRAIINMREKNYGELNPYVRKLANQIELGVPVEKAMHTFSKDVDSAIVSRATALINQAERSGGQIDYILNSTAKSISEVEKLKKERKSTIYNLVVQGYIIFFVFIAIILVMEFKIIPLTAGIGEFGNFGSISSQNLGNAAVATQTQEIDVNSFTMPLLYLLLSQGFFMGLVIGKLTEGSVRRGIKHSLILMTTALLVSGGARLFFGT